MPDDPRMAQGPHDRARWRQVSDLVDAVLDLPPAQREAFLQRACPGAMRGEVERLVRAGERGGFLDAPASAFAAPLLVPSADPRRADEADALATLRDALADRYTIAGEIGRGGMAIVYLARDRSSDRQVAIKLLRSELTAAVGAERFLREIATVSRLTHPHILPLLASGDARGLLWFAMPYVAGETLRERLDRDGRLPPPEAIRIATDLADALDHAHRSGVLHRDLKPENVLLGDGCALLTDFGIARAITQSSARDAAEERDRPLTGTGVSLGTPAYMSPEQASGSRTLDARSDVYALGCMLYEMLTGRPPFRGPTAYHVIRQQVATAAPRLETTLPHIAPVVAAAVARALAKSPDQRFAGMDAFARALASPADRAEATPLPAADDEATTDAVTRRPSVRGLFRRWLEGAG